ncbi:MAG: hypothetical protein U9N30_07285 [Campylobacterota bacterium]|nr:hypothetical protein [Campylobacterota bacterium]
MVDLDREVIEITGNYLPTYNEIHSNNYDILYIDIIQYFKHNTNKFDIVIIDLVDISDNTLHLYDETFLTLLEKNTTKNSIIVTQASSLLSFENHNKIVKEIYKKYPYIKRFGSYIPSFYDYWGFAIYSKNNFNISSISENKLEMLNNKDILNSFDIPNYIDKNLICTE